MSKPKTKTDAEHEEWVKKRTAMRIRHAHQLAEKKEHEAKVAIAKRKKQEEKEIKEHKEYIKGILEAGKKKDGGRRTRRR